MPDAQQQSHRRRYLLSLLAGCFLIATVAYFVVGPEATSTPIRVQIGSPRNDIPPSFPQGVPAPTAADTVTAQKGFQYLISYTEGGFAPSTLTIEKGETVRFANNSGANLSVALGVAVQSPILGHGQYWERTFAEAGTFRYRDSISEKEGTITVE